MSNNSKQKKVNEVRIVKTLERLQKLKAFKEGGESGKADRLLSMGYLVHTVADAYTEEANEIFAKYGLMSSRVKTAANNLSQSFDAYDKAMSSLIGDERQKVNMCDDYETMRSLCDQFMNAASVEEGGEAAPDDKTISKEQFMAFLFALQDDVRNHYGTYDSNYVIGMLSDIAYRAAKVRFVGKEGEE